MLENPVECYSSWVCLEVRNLQKPLSLTGVNGTTQEPRQPNKLFRKQLLHFVDKFSKYFGVNGHTKSPLIRPREHHACEVRKEQVFGGALAQAAAQAQLNVFWLSCWVPWQNESCLCRRLPTSQHCRKNSTRRASSRKNMGKNWKTTSLLKILNSMRHWKKQAVICHKTKPPISPCLGELFESLAPKRGDDRTWRWPRA